MSAAAQHRRPSPTPTPHHVFTLSLESAETSGHDVASRATSWLAQRWDANLRSLYTLQWAHRHALHATFHMPAPSSEHDLERALYSEISRNVPDLEVRIRPWQPKADSVPLSSYYDLALYATDEAGIAAAVTTLLCNLGVRILALSGSSYRDPLSGEPLSAVQMKIVCPRGMTSTELDRAIEQASNKGWWHTLRPTMPARLAI